MPVVRIVGSVPESIGDLPQQLRDRGFDVETVSDAANCAPGTLEISLEECSTEEALSRALALAQGNDLAILVSPGAIVPALPVLDSTEEQIPPATAEVPVSVQDSMPPAAESIEPPAHAQLAGAEPAFLPVMEQQDEPAPLPDTDWMQPEPVTALASNADEGSDWPIWQVAREDEQVPRPAVPLPRPESPILTEHVAALHGLRRRFLAAARVNRILPDDRLFTRIAVSSAALAILLLVLGVAAHRFRPVPSRVLHGSSEAMQPAPFQRPATVSAPITASAVVSADTAEPAPGVTPASAHLRVRGSSQLASGRSRTKASADAGFVAKDTVVHFNPLRSQPLSQTAKQQPGVKYYTDLKQ